MHYPPAPVFNDRQVRVLTPRQPRAVEEADRAGGKHEEVQQGCDARRCLEGRTSGANHQEEPDQQSNEQQNLPAAAQIDILVALMSPKERVGVGELVLDAHPFAGQRSHDNEEQGAEQHMDAKCLELRFLSADQRSDEETGGQPGGGDPEDAESARARCE